MNRSDFGKTKNGESASLYYLKNKNGMEAAITDFGGAIVRVIVPDKQGGKRDVVLGFDRIEAYEADGDSVGVPIGRVTNRIAGGSFELNGKTYDLVKNDNGNTLHGGRDFYGKRIWEVKSVDEQSITLALDSPDGDQGFPGNAKIELTYVLTDENELELCYQMSSDQDTYISMTNHSYFNLNGHKSGDVLDHKVQILADTYTVADAESIPTGEIASVEGTPMDFRVPKKIGQDIKADFAAITSCKGYDTNWCPNQEAPGAFRKVAEASSEESGLAMEVFSDLPGMQMYTSNFLDHMEGKDGAVYNQYQAVCLETQYYPDAVHHDGFEKPFVGAGEAKSTRTVYKFRVME